ncbi:MAG: serine hydrolase [Candidatus Hydrogenedentota bacterium]
MPRLSLLITMSCLGLGFCVPVAADEPRAPSYICVEAETGLVLAASDADVRRAPASMVKMLIMLIVCEGVEAGTWTLDTPVPVSGHAQYMGGTQVYLEEGETWPLGQLLQAVCVASANDAAMAIAEGLFGSKLECLAAMNKRAAELGMLDSRFHSVHGLPPDPGDEIDVTTARDMALLARACVRVPRLMEWVRQKELRFKPGQAVYYNTNKLLWRMDDCDGLKTGYIRAAGHCITATAERNGVRLIAVVMGETSSNGRFDRAKTLLEDGFARVRRVQVATAGRPLGDPLPIVCGTKQYAPLVAVKDVSVTCTADDVANITLVGEHPAQIVAPAPSGTVVGSVRVELGDRVAGSTPVCLGAPVALDLTRLLLFGTAVP